MDPVSDALSLPCQSFRMKDMAKRKAREIGPFLLWVDAVWVRDESGYNFVWKR